MADTQVGNDSTMGWELRRKGGSIEVEGPLLAGEHSRRPYKDLAFERDLERIWSVEREWEGVQGKWMLKVPMAAGPSRTW